jgi:hypothetical protein
VRFPFFNQANVMRFQKANYHFRSSRHFRLLLIFIAAGFVYGLWSVGVSACTCFGPSRACEAITNAEVIFLGESIEFIPDPTDARNYLFRFRVESIYKGLLPDTREVLVDGGYSGMCGTAYPTGKRYIIFGGKKTNDPLLVMSGMCSGSRDADTHQEDIDFLESYKRGEPQTTIARVYGKVGQGSWVDKGDSYDEAAPLGGATVVLENAEQRFSVMSQADGSYQFVGIPEGNYRLSAKLAPFVPTPPFEEVIVRNGACTPTSITLQANCTLEGTLLDPTGKPMVKEQVELVRRNLEGEWDRNSSMWKQTDQQGRFRFSELATGEYLMGYEIWGDYPSDSSPFPTHYYPGVRERSRAEVIHLSSVGQSVKGMKLKLPPPHTGRKITVRVVTADGTPVGDNELQVSTKRGWLMLKNLRGSQNREATEFYGYQEREYEFTAEYHLDEGTNIPYFAKRTLLAEPVKLSPGKEDAELVLVLPNPPKETPQSVKTRKFPIVVASLIAAGILATAFFLFRHFINKKPYADL